MPPKNSPPSTNSSPKSTYLLIYNAVSAVLWTSILYKTITIGTQEVLNARKGSEFFGRGAGYGGLEALGNGKVYDELEGWVRAVQTLAVAEVFHSVFGIVRAPLLTTLMQVSSRLLLTHLIAAPFPRTTRPSPAYTTMLLAWSVTEVIRYSFFTFTLSGRGVPGLVTWLRYNTFLVLYPLGVGSECWLVWKAIPEAGRKAEVLGWGLWAVLAIYVPGFYVLFTHMLKQRSRIGNLRR